MLDGSAMNATHQRYSSEANDKFLESPEFESAVADETAESPEFESAVADETAEIPEVSSAAADSYTMTTYIALVCRISTPAKLRHHIVR